ncbi:MAG: GNAT family N-acetyltransferase [bacterium]|nr:GNAT family N-acetyltransferase [bacterium]
MIETVSPDSQYYEQVVELGNASRATLGHLPYSVIQEAAAECRVLAWVDNGEVKGYVLYRKRVRRGDISLTHLCVDRDQRGRGIARKLVEGIVKENPHRAGIYASCRKDYEAHSMWPQLGFQHLGEKPGRSRAGHPLVTWWRPIAAKALFGEPEQEDAHVDDRVLVIVGTSVLLDILEQRNFPASVGLTADWVTDVAELAVTPQSRSDLLDDDLGDEGLVSALSEFRMLEPSDAAWQVALSQLQAEPSVAALKSADLRGVAQAVAEGAIYFVSRDGDLLNQAEQIEQMTGLNLVSPDDFLLRLQALGSDQSYQTRVIAASGISLATVLEMLSNADLLAFCHQHLGELSTSLRQRLDTAVANGGRIEHLVTDSGDSLALAAMYRNHANVTVTALRVIQGQQAYTAARQMIYHLRSIIASEGSADVVVDDQTSLTVEWALRDEGFKPDSATWKAVVQIGIFGADDALPQELSKVGSEGLNAHLVREYERYAWPAKVFSGATQSYMVPIKPEYARVLLGYEEAQTRLFETHSRAAAARENTYYRAPRSSFEVPARIIWWVSGGRAMGGARAMSWLDEVDTGDPQRLFRKHQDRGVLNERQVCSSAKPFGKSKALAATALLFSQTEVFDRPVSIARAQELCPDMRIPGYFATTRQVDEQSVRALYEEGLRSDD